MGSGFWLGSGRLWWVLVGFWLGSGGFWPASGIVLAGETREFEKFNTQVAKVVALGALAFKKKDTLEPWPEGVWADVNSFVRVPKYGGDRFEVAIPNEPEEPALFMLINDHELIAKIKGDPLNCQHEYVNR